MHGVARCRLRWFGPILSVLLYGLLASLGVCQSIRIDVTPGHAVKSFVPSEALGAGIDRISTASTDKVFTEPIMKQVLSAGWQPVSYRQNTELHVEAWHWNPQGKWSEPGDKGYFVGEAKPGEFIRHSFGYALPHRGFTRNEGTDANGFSRITDGDETTYWKSNPYLTKAFTGEDDSNYPQWVVVDLAHSHPINAIRISWAETYARRYLVQYWSGSESPIRQPTKGAWVTFRGGDIANGSGGKAQLELNPDPMSVRYLRISMSESSNTCDAHDSADRRNCVGYAIREIYLGTASADGRFHDLVRHTADLDQTITYCSSVDPWHEPTGIQDKGDQVGMDLFFTSGYTRGLPAMIPVSLLYGTPEDSVNQIAYLKAQGYPIAYIEMGEEPDGQYMLPEDYGALYLQWAAGHTLVTSYAVRRPDGQWALMLVNKDQENAHSLRLSFHDASTNSESAFTGPVAMITFGSEQYQWKAEPNAGSANPDGPSAKSQVSAGPGTTYTLSQASVTVLRGHIANTRDR